MSAWLLKIIGVVFLGVMVDILYPNGTTNKFCKGIFSLITLLVIISPIFNINLDTIKGQNESIVVSSDYKTVNDRLLKSEIDIILDEYDINDATVEIDSILTNGEYYLSNIYVDIGNIVLSDFDVNINIYEDMAEKISKAIGIEKDKVIVYG